MLGLARKAMVLAESRAGHSVKGFWTRYKLEPCQRAVLNPEIHPFSREYYRIIDRITRGETP